MRKVFLFIGIGCTLAAFSLLSRHRDFDPRSSLTGGWKARPEQHGCIWDAYFSPDGKRLLFRVKDELGNQSRADTYLYSLSDGNTRKLPISRLPDFPGQPWAPDSKHIAFYESSACEIFNLETNSVVETFRTALREWSPDGKKQLFVNYMTNDMYLRDVESGDWTVLPREVGESRLIWSRDCSSLLYFDWDTKNIMQYTIKDGTVSKLASLNGYGNRFYALLVPSRLTDYVYFTAPRQRAERFGQKVILRRLDIRSGAIEDVFDSGLDQDKGGIGLIYLTQTEDPMYYYQSITEEDGKQNRSMMTLNMKAGESKVLWEGNYRYRDYSYKADMFAVTTNDSRTICLFDVKTKTLRQIFPAD